MASSEIILENRMSSRVIHRVACHFDSISLPLRAIVYYLFVAEQVE